MNKTSFVKDPSTSFTPAEITRDQIRHKFIGSYPEKGKDPRITYDGEWLIGHVEGYKIAGATMDRCLNEAILPVIDDPEFILLEDREVIVENVQALWNLS